MTHTLKKILPAVLIVLLALAAYSNSFDVPFQFDGKEYIVKSPYIKSLQLLPELWFKDASHKARYIPYLSFALNYHFHELDVFGYHAVNLAIHIINAFLVWWLVRLICSSPKMDASGYGNTIGFAAALLFVSHPLQTQAVTYIVQRFASLATLFYLLSLCFYLKGRLSRRFVYYLCAGFAALLGMFTKQIVLTLPFMVLVTELMFVSGVDDLKKHKKAIAVLAVILLLFILIIPALYSFRFSNLLAYQQKSGSHYGDFLTIKTYFLTQSRVLLTYIRLLFFPFGQTLDYDFPMSHSLFEVKTFLCGLTIIALVVGGFLLRKKRPLITFGIFFFFIAASVESSIIVITHVIFEHRAYLPSAGFFMAFSAGIFGLCKPVGAAHVRPLRMGIIIILAIVCAFLTFQRNKVWHSEIALWSDALEKAPNKARPYKNLGIAYAEKGALQKALSLLQKAYALQPDDVDMLNNLGNVYNRLGDKQKAIEMYKKALEVSPGHAAAHNNLGSAYYDLGDLDSALHHYERARDLDPIDATVYYNLANVYFRKGNKQRAAWFNRQAISFNPNYAQAHQNLGVIHSEAGRDEKAKEHYLKAIEIDPGFGKAYNNLAALYYKKKDFEEAIRYVDRAQKFGYPVNPLFLKALETYR